MVLQGIDCIAQHAQLFKGKRLGLITSVSGVNRKLQSSIDILHGTFGLQALFAPEHGVRGEIAAGGMVDFTTDYSTGLPVYSLYRKDAKRFTPEMLALVDAVIYDIQDLGTRYYTFISTLLYALEDCAAAGKELIVLDRANPLGGMVCEGNIQDAQHYSFVGAFPLCMRYGLTAGELARMMNSVLKIGCILHVVPCAGWRRGMLFPQTQNIWIMPSLGIPHFETALLYPGTCLFEGTNLSEGRGTSCPFEIIGAPYINGPQLVEWMQRKNLPGVAFTAAYFTPTASKHMGARCEGVHIHITDYHAFRPVRTALELLFAVAQLYEKDFAFLPPIEAGRRPFISLLFGNDALHTHSLTKEQILDGFCADERAFAAQKQQFHYYD